jgi:hypothetical protein
MAKVQSFADKAAKLQKKHQETVICPDTNKETRLLNVKFIESVKTDKGTVKFLTKNLKVYESTLKPYNP